MSSWVGLTLLAIAPAGLGACRMRRHRVAALLTLCCLAAGGASAQVPTTMSYQGRLLENSTEQEPVGSTVDIFFSIWSGPETDPAAVEVWTETWNGVALSNGIFSVLLGSNGSPLDPAVFQGDSSLYLELQVDGETLSPRQQLASTPFALVDQPANELQDLSLAGDTLGLSGSAATVDLSTYLDNTDAQTLSLSGDALTISGSGSSVDLAAAAVIADLQARVLELQRLSSITRRVFVSSTVHQGDFGGVAAGDAICQGLADDAGLGGTFKAWLADTLGNTPAARFTHSVVPYVLVDGTVVADDWSDLTDGVLSSGILLDEQGNLVEGINDYVWTGVNTAGELSGPNCLDWTTTSHQGRAGIAIEATGPIPERWTSRAAFDCTYFHHLYCFEQEPAPPAVLRVGR